MKGHVKSPADSYHLCHRLVRAVALGPDVDRNCYAPAPKRFQHSHQTCFVIGIFRLISYSQADADSTCVQRLHDLSADLFLFVLCERLRTITCHTCPDGPSAHKHSCVDAALHFPEAGQVLFHGRGRICRFLFSLKSSPRLCSDEASQEMFCLLLMHPSLRRS